MRVALGSDKSGFLLKEAIKQYLTQSSISFEDLGTQDTENPKGFFVVAPKVAEQIQQGSFDLGILVCGTGAGMSIVANKFHNVHAVACESVYSAKMARAINGAQILCMGGWIVAPEMGVKIAEAFLTTSFLEGLEEWRKEWLTKAADHVREIEEKIYKQE